MFKYLKSIITKLFTKSNTDNNITNNIQEQIIIITRLEFSEYEKLEKLLNANTLVSNTTSDIEAGFKLGVQHVLKQLRTGYVVPDSYKR